MNTGVYLLLGTNLGDREANLALANQYISRLIGAIITASGVYKTSAWGNTDQPEFYNQVIEINPHLTPEDTLQIIHSIEAEMGRVRTEKWGMRIIDIDILLWQHLILTRHDLTIPHPGIPIRRFTLTPLAEIAPDFIHPSLNKSINTLLHECVDELSVERLSL